MSTVIPSDAEVKHAIATAYSMVTPKDEVTQRVLMAEVDAWWEELDLQHKLTAYALASRIFPRGGDDD